MSQPAPADAGDAPAAATANAGESWLTIPHAVQVLALAPAIFAMRALLAYFERGVPWWLDAATGIAGVLSLVAILFVAWKANDRGRAGLAAGVVLFGHYALGGDVGAALVYLGIGLAGSLVHKRALEAGFITFLGALWRQDAAFGHLFVLVGGALLAYHLLRQDADMAASA